MKRSKVHDDLSCSAASVREIFCEVVLFSFSLASFLGPVSIMIGERLYLSHEQRSYCLCWAMTAVTWWNSHAVAHLVGFPLWVSGKV
jgi:hypothetical protein